MFATRVTAIRAGRALLGAELRDVSDVVVVVEGPTIASAGPASETTVPDGAETVDASDQLLIPGFIDAHVHIGFYPPSLVVRGGVTTVRDLGWPTDTIFEVAARSQSAAEGGWDGPTVHAVGPILTAPGGYPARAAWAPAGTALEIRDAAHASDAVAELAERGAIAIKTALDPVVGPVLDEDTLRVIVDAAHAHALKVTSHVHGVGQLGIAIRAGVDELAHMVLGTQRISDERIHEMVAAEMTVVPTLSIRRGIDRRVAIGNTRRFISAGGEVIYGTDLGNGGPRPGIDAREVKAMSGAGMSPKDAIAAATVRAAAYLGLESTGVLAAGADADIVGLGGDPLARVRDLTDVRLVLRRGRRVR